jgi:DNA-binding transcriptional LysR family regulator
VLSTALTYFREVAVSGSLRRAADRLSVAPSAISRQIAKLESELDVALFNRNSRGIVLTHAGQRLLEYAEQARATFDALSLDIREMTAAATGSVKIVTVEGVVSYFLSKYVTSFAKDHPRVRIGVSVIGARSVLDALREGRADMALTFGGSATKGFVQHARLEQPLCVVVATAHPLARRKSVSFEELAGMPVALPDPSFEIRAMVDRMAKHKGIEFDRVIEANMLEMVKGVVRNSRLVTFLPRYAALREIASRELRVVPLRDQSFANTSFVLLTSRSAHLSPAAQALLERLEAGMSAYGKRA